MERAIFNRTRLLLGEEAMTDIGAKRVIVFGVGGVGSWCAEALVRSGVKWLTIVDSDKVSITNVNRQLMATTATIGIVKVEAMKERLLSINPAANIDAVPKVYSQDTAGEFPLEDYDVVVDCIDSLKDKALLIYNATRNPGKLYSSMGAALKMDPTRIRVAEFWKVRGCPLARALRQKFKRKKEYPAKKFLCVFSDELLPNKGVNDFMEEAPGMFHKAQTNGTLMHVTAIFGLTLAGLILNDITNGLRNS